MYICLEGLKGCGKTTLLTAAQQLLTRYRVPFSVVAPTQPIDSKLSWQERLSEHVRCLRRIDLWNEYLYAERARHAAATANWQQPLVLGDRCIVTSYVTRWRHWGNPQACIERVDKLAGKMPAPDHVILLDVDPQVAWERIQVRKRTYGQHDETLVRLWEVREAYRQITTYGIAHLQRTQWHVLDANCSPQQVLHAWVQLMTQLAPTALFSLQLN